MQESQQEYSLCVFRFFKTKKDFSKPKNARKSRRVLTVCIQMVDHIRRKCGRPLSRLLLHYHYLIIIIISECIIIVVIIMFTAIVIIALIIFLNSLVWWAVGSFIIIILSLSYHYLTIILSLS